MPPKPNAGMKNSRTPWRLKLRPEMEPKVGDDPKGRGKMLVPTPMLMAEEIRKVQKGKLLTTTELRDRLATRFKADFTCPLVTGIFLNIIAGATEDNLAAGEKPLAPYWRIIQDDRTLSHKRPGGPYIQAKRLRAEGHRIANHGLKLYVVDDV